MITRGATPAAGMVAAISPGELREQESYVLGAVHSPEVADAILRAFLDPDVALDRAFAVDAAENLLLAVNGFKWALHGGECCARGGGVGVSGLPTFAWHAAEEWLLAGAASHGWQTGLWGGALHCPSRR